MNHSKFTHVPHTVIVYYVPMEVNGLQLLAGVIMAMVCWENEHNSKHTKLCCEKSQKENMLCF